MTLAVWKPQRSKIDCIRKHYGKEEKIRKPWAFIWSCEKGIKNGDATLERIETLIKSIRDKDLDVCLGNAFPVRWADNKRFERKNLFLENEGTDLLYLDFDKHDEKISLDTDLPTRVRLCLSRLPIQFQEAGLVAFYSSSAYWQKTDPTRASVHIIILLDKIYPHEKIKAWQKQYSDFLDPATAIRTQPLYVAKPRFIDTTAREIQGDEIYLQEGAKVALGKIDYKKGEENHPDVPLMEAMSKDIEGWKEHSLKLANSGELDGRRGKYLFDTFLRKIFHERERVGEYLKIIKENPILYANPENKDRTWKDVKEIYNGALRYVNTRLLGRSIKERERFSIKEVTTKTLSIDDIKDFPTKNAITLIKSGCNTRKTTGIIDPYIKLGGFKSAMYVTTDIASIESFINNDNVKANFRSYLEKGHKERRDWMQQQDWLATTEQSLRYALVDGRSYPNDEPPELIIIDECEAVAMNIRNPNSMRSANILYDMCKRAKAVLMLDADMTDDLTGFLANSLADQTGKETSVLLNRFDWNSEKRIHMLNSGNQAVATVEALLDAGERVYLHVGFGDQGERKQISKLIKHFTNHLKNDHNAVKGFDANSVPRELRRNPNKVIQEWFKKGLRLLIHSPWSKRSWDYNPMIEGAIEFDSNVGIYPKPFFSHVNINQQDWRMRKTRNSFIYISKERNYTAINYYDEQIDRGLFKIDEGLDHQLLRAAEKRRSDEKSNIRDAYIEMVTRQGADISYDFIHEPLSDEHDGKLTRLLSEAEESALEEAIKTSWEKPRERKNILGKFYKDSETVCANGRFPHGSGVKPYETDDYDEYRQIYIRNSRIKSEQVKDILTIWNMGAEEREIFDIEEPANLAIIKGRLLDCVDRALEDYYPEGIIKFPNTLLLDRERFQVCIDQEGRSNLGRYIKDHFNIADEEIPWLNASHKKNYLGYFEDCLKFLDLSYTREEVIPKKEPKIEIIKEYESKNGLKKSLLVNEKIDQINYKITEKIKQGRDLTPKEEQWQRARGTNYYIALKDLRSRVIYENIGRRAYGRQALQTENFSVTSMDYKNENKKSTEGLAL